MQSIGSRPKVDASDQTVPLVCLKAVDRLIAGNTGRLKTFQMISANTSSNLYMSESELLEKLRVNNA